MNKTNLLIDGAILASFLVAMEPRFSGIAIHEWLSLALAATIVAHLLLHWKWIIGVGGRFFKKLWHTSRLKFVVDSLLFVSFITLMLSGILISKSALPTLGIQLGEVSRTWRMLHTQSADLSMLLVGLHFALNWDWVVGMLKRYLIDPLARLLRPRQVQQPVVVQADEQQ
jgi:hypothetical protein